MFEKFIQKEKPFIEEKLFFYLDSLKIPGVLYEAMKYSLSAGGKRIRPFLAIAVSQLLNKKKEVVMPYACALEFIHTYSLMHDDLPALDDDDIRRGQLSSHKVFGEDIAVLAGDAFNTDAFSILFEHGKGNFQQGAGYLAKAGGGRGMVLGQIEDCTVPEKERTVDILNSINLLKTAKLLMASTAGTALWLDSGKESVAALEKYGLNLGLAFQITDDILDIASSTEEFGKTVGSDASSNKVTYPLLVGLERAEEKAYDFSKKAVAELGAFNDSEWKDVLVELAEYAVRRKK